VIVARGDTLYFTVSRAERLDGPVVVIEGSFEPFSSQARASPNTVFLERTKPTGTRLA
jgi:hypothetical protein